MSSAAISNQIRFAAGAWVLFLDFFFVFSAMANFWLRVGACSWNQAFVFGFWFPRERAKNGPRHRIVTILRPFDKLKATMARPEGCEDRSRILDTDGR